MWSGPSQFYLFLLRSPLAPHTVNLKVSIGSIYLRLIAKGEFVGQTRVSHYSLSTVSCTRQSLTSPRLATLYLTIIG